MASTTIGWFWKRGSVAGRGLPRHHKRRGKGGRSGNRETRNMASPRRPPAVWPPGRCPRQAARQTRRRAWRPLHNAGGICGQARRECDLGGIRFVGVGRQSGRNPRVRNRAGIKFASLTGVCMPGQATASKVVTLRAKRLDLSDGTVLSVKTVVSGSECFSGLIHTKVPRRSIRKKQSIPNCWSIRNGRRIRNKRNALCRVPNLPGMAVAENTRGWFRSNSHGGRSKAGYLGRRRLVDRGAIFARQPIAGPLEIEQIGQELYRLVEKGKHKRLVLDFSNVEFLSMKL